MAIIKCKMCGGDLALIEGQSVAECEYCGSWQTVPAADNEKKLTLFARANRLRAACDFDKAAGIYESIVADFPDEAEAYWGLVLCKYGIEYVDDPATGKKIPTCHRSSFDSVMDDGNFEQAMENADEVALRVYREEAKQIEGIRKGILEVSSNEQPYDIFICYKETDVNGDRTVDSLLAQDIYDALTGRGYRVFFSRITLEDKLGQAYEPYIFAALNSARIMLAVGTCYEHYNAVWVKNEWSRYLKIIAQDKNKYLIPCYKDIDAYDIPKEFAHLQGQDMGKVGATQDLLRGIAKILPSQESMFAAARKPTTDVSAMVIRGQFALEDGEWARADEYFERALDENPENSKAYLGKVLVGLRLSAAEQINDRFVKLEGDKNFERAIKFSSGADKAQLENIKDLADRKWLVKRLTVGLKKISRKKEQDEIFYSKATQALNCAKTSDEFLAAAKQLKVIAGYKDAEILAEKAMQEGERILLEQKEKARQAERIRLEKIEKMLNARKKLSSVKTMVSAGGQHIVGLCLDGTVVAAGDSEYGQCAVSGWRDIVAISAGAEHTVGLKSDGMVVAIGRNGEDRCNVSGWRDIVAISAGSRHTAGIKSDGTVVAIGSNRDGQCNVSGWRDIVAISASYRNTIGLKSNGTVVAAGDNYYGQCNVSGWRDIVAISTGSGHTVGLKSDGTVVAVGRNGEGRCNVSGWRDIVAISTGSGYTVGLKADGTVVAVGYNEAGQCKVSDWTNIVAISAGSYHTVGLKADGTVVAVGLNGYGWSHVSHWKLFQSADTLERERSAAAQERKVIDQARMAAVEREKQQSTWRAFGKCQYCGGTFKGFFTKKCEKCGTIRDY